jgi:hypothetical protein
VSPLCALPQLGVGILFDTDVYELATQNVLNPGGVQQPSGTCFYRGDTEAAKRFQDISGCPSGTEIPMTDSCGHWSEDCFQDSELMGPFGGEALSEITVGSLEDLGFEVDYSQADRMYKSDLAPKCRCNERGLMEMSEMGGQSLPETADAESDTEEGLFFDLNEFRAVQYAYQLMGEYKAAAIELENQGKMTAMEAGLRDIGLEAVSVLYVDNNGKVRDMIVRNQRSAGKQ